MTITPPRTDAAAAPAEDRPPPDAPTGPGWGRPALLVLLLTTAVLYLWGLGASGWASSFHSAAV